MMKLYFGTNTGLDKQRIDKTSRTKKLKGNVQFLNVVYEATRGEVLFQKNECTLRKTQSS